MLTDCELGVVILAGTGCRLTEVMAMRWEDVDLDKRTWRVPTWKKWGRREIPLSKLVADALGERLDRVGLVLRVSRDALPAHLRRAGTTARDLRRRFALEAIAGWADKNTVAAYLGLKGGAV